MKATTDEKVKRRGRSTPCLAAPLATAREMTRHQYSYTAAIVPELFLRAPRAWEDPSTLPSIAKEAPLEPIEVEHNPSTGNSEEDRPGEDESSLKKRRHEEKKHDRREKRHSHDPDSRRKRKKDMDRRRRDSDSN